MINTKDTELQELERKLNNANQRVSYYKSKAEKPNKRPKGESPAAKARRLQVCQEWNDKRRASEIVIARATTNNEAEYNDAMAALKKMHIDEIRELAKGHEAEVAAEVIVRQQERAAKVAGKAKVTAPAPTTLQTIPKRPSKSIKAEAASAVRAPKEVSPTTLNVSNLEKAQQIASRRLGFDLTKEQTIDHVISRFLQNYN